MNTGGSNEQTGFWQSLKAATPLLATVFIPLVLAYVGNGYTSAIKQNEIGQRYVEIAMKILSEPVDKENPNTGTREWAVKLVDYYSEVKMTEGVKAELSSKEISAAIDSIKEVGL